MKKGILIGLLCLFMSGCTPALDEGYDETVLNEKTVEIVQYLNDKKYDAICAMGDEQMNTPAVAEKVKVAWESVQNEFGTFKEFDKFEYTSKDGNAIVLAIGTYEHNKVQFTVTFNSDMQMIGFFFK